jgi:hypothetical protein
VPAQPPPTQAPGAAPAAQPAPALLAGKKRAGSRQKRKAQHAQQQVGDGGPEAPRDAVLDLLLQGL